MTATKKKEKARPRRASATAPLRTGADTCKTGSGAGKRAGSKSDPVRRQSNHACPDDHAGKRKCANTAAVGGLSGAHRRRHTKQGRCDKIQTLQLHAPRGHTAQSSCRVEQERDNTCRGLAEGKAALAHGPGLRPAPGRAGAEASAE